MKKNNFLPFTNIRFNSSLANKIDKEIILNFINDQKNNNKLIENT